MNLHSNDPESWLETVWAALHAYREDCIPESDPTYNDQWNDITTAMAWIREGLKLPDEISMEPPRPTWEKQIPEFDGLEIKPCREELFEDEPDKNYVEPCEPHEAHFWTVYGHFKTGGCNALEDFETKAKAEEFAAKLLNDYPHLNEHGLYHPYK